MSLVEIGTVHLELSRAIESGDPDEVLPLAWRAYRTELLARLRTQGLSVQQCEEALQEVFATMYVEWSRFDGGDLRAWLHALARFEGLTVLRRQQRAERPAEIWVPRDADAEARAVSHQELEAVARFRDQLSATERRILDAPLSHDGDEQLRDALLGDLGVAMTLNAIWLKRTELRQLLYLHTGREADHDG